MVSVNILPVIIWSWSFFFFSNMVQFWFGLTSPSRLRQVFSHNTYNNSTAQFKTPGICGMTCLTAASQVFFWRDLFLILGLTGPRLSCWKRTNQQSCCVIRVIRFSDCCCCCYHFTPLYEIVTKLLFELLVFSWKLFMKEELTKLIGLDQGCQT